MIIETITYIDRDSASATFVLHNFSLCVLCGSRWCSVVVMVCARSPRCGMGGDTCATSCFVARTRTHPITLTHTHADDATAQRHSACLQRAPSFRRSGKLRLPRRPGPLQMPSISAGHSCPPAPSGAGKRAGARTSSRRLRRLS